MKNLIAISSYSLRQCLGPIRVSMRGPDGKIAEFFWDQPQTMTLLELPRAFRDHFGQSAIEICYFHLPNKDPQYISTLKKALADANMQLINMPIDVGDISNANPVWREEDLTAIEGCMQVAADLGTQMVRVNTGNPMSPVPPAPLEVTIDSFRRLGQTARKLGLILLVENHGGISSNPDPLIKILEGAGQDNLKLLLDIGNFEPLISMQMALIQGLPVPEGDISPLYDAIKKLAPYAYIIHAKAHEFDSAGEPIRLDVARALSIIRDAGFTGPISIEYEGSEGDPWENTRRTLAIVEKVFSGENPATLTN
jgi:sugar phosphate isomerase/epimerase